MNRFIIPLENEYDTHTLGARLAPLLRTGDVVCLSGSLGAGKTTLARGILRTRTDFTQIPSPTFTLVEIYETPDLAIWHFDLYRLEKERDIWDLGYEEALEDAVSIIEWPERIRALLPQDTLDIRLRTQQDGRTAVITPAGRWKTRLKSMQMPREQDHE